MKTKKLNVAQAAAFTLVELLTVIAVIVVLVGLTVGIIGHAQTKGDLAKADAQLQMIAMFLTKYEKEFAEFPEADESGDDTYGAQVLYQALTGDGNDLLGGDEPSDGRISDEEAEDWKGIGLRDDNQGLVRPGEYYLVDPFGQPWQYVSYDKNRPTATNNRNFDLWSYAQDKTKKNDVKWVKNW